MTTDQSSATLLPLNGEKLISLSTVGEMFPGHRGNAHINASTVFRWVNRGVRLPNGDRLRLEAVKVGVRWLSSAEAVSRFVRALTAGGTLIDEASVRIESPAARTQAARVASRELDSLINKK